MWGPVAALAVGCGGRVGPTYAAVGPELADGGRGASEGGTSSALEPQPPATEGGASSYAQEGGALSSGASAPGTAGVTCDTVASVSPSGANPYGPWSYGWSSTLGSAFGIYDHYLADASGYDGLLDVWNASPEASLADPPGSLPAAFYNPSGMTIEVSSITAPPWQFFLHPGPQGQYSIARWTAPQAGNFAVQAVFEGIDSGPTTTDVHLLHNGEDAAAGGYINVNGGTNSYSFAMMLALAAGDTIDFAVGDGGNGYANDSTGLAASVCAAGVNPPPQ
jgi:hypothetical protein